jgi:predicted lipoprotein
MKRPFVRIACLVVVTAIIGFAAFAIPGNASVKQYFAVRTVNKVLESYTDNTVLKTLALIVDGIKELNAAAVKLQTDLTDESLAAAADAWRAARAYWLMAFPFMYGPGSFYDFDKQIATWPFEKVLVDHALREIEVGRLQVDSRFLREERTSSMRGFYTAEYLLFRNGQPRKAKDVGAAELKYLAAVTQAMLEESIDFEASWLGTDNLPPDKAEILKKAQLKSRSSYAAELKNAGQPGSRYFSQSVALQEIFQDCIATLQDDVQPAISELLDAPGAGDANYWDNHNIYTDLQNRLKGVENAYIGGVMGSRGHSISELVAGKSAVLDKRVKIALAHAAHSIAAIGDPYSGEHDENRDLAVRIAEAECTKLINRLNVAALLVTTDPALRPWAAYGK